MNEKPIASKTQTSAPTGRSPRPWPAPLRRWAKLLLRIRLIQTLVVGLLAAALPGGGVLAALLAITAAITAVLTRQALRASPGPVPMFGLCGPPICSGLFTWSSVIGLVSWRIPAYSMCWIIAEAALLLGALLMALVGAHQQVWKSRTT